VLVVSNIDLTTNVPVMKPSKFLEASIEDFTLNINNDYRYLKTGYYVSLHAEILGNPVAQAKFLRLINKLPKMITRLENEDQEGEDDSGLESKDELP
jgi:hypothetical protein